ncbi:hypothetical protein D3C87_1610620 [compost metagenome]
MRLGARLRRQMTYEAGLVCGALQRRVMDNDQFAGIGEVHVEFDRIDTELEHVAKAGQRVFRPQITSAAVAGDLGSIHEKFLG